MPLSSDASIATNIIDFGDAPEAPPVAAQLSYDVPLPGFLVGRRLVELGLGDIAWKGEGPSQAGVDVAEEIALEEVEGGASYVFDPMKLWVLMENHVFATPLTAQITPLVLTATAVPPKFVVTPRIAASFVQPVLSSQPFSPPTSPAETGEGEEERAEYSSREVRTREDASRLPQSSPAVPPPPGNVGLTPDDDGMGFDLGGVPPELLETLMRNLRTLGMTGTLQIPYVKWGGGVGSAEVTPTDAPNPTLFLIEVYGISSFLGDYGLGRTVRTFSLLPGETTTMNLKTWRSTEEKVAKGSSIVDSFDSKAADRFSGSLAVEGSDKKTDSNNHFWSAEVKANASFGIGSVEATAKGGGDYHAAREQFTKSMGETVVEHVNESNAARELTITASSERTQTSGEESSVERIISNVNMRRTLNFVFRELNQEYVTKIHLKEIQIGFSNGQLGSFRKTRLSGLRPFLRELLATDEEVDRVASEIVALSTVLFDLDDQAVPVLESIELAPDGQSWQPPAAAGPDERGNYSPPTSTMHYRFKKGPLGQTGTNQVDGVLVERRDVVLRTDSVVVEALLGQADALDPYAMEAQRSDAEAKSLRNERERVAQAALTGVVDAEERARLYSEMFNPNGELKIALDQTP